MATAKKSGIKFGAGLEVHTDCRNLASPRPSAAPEAGAGRARKRVLPAFRKVEGEALPMTMKLELTPALTRSQIAGQRIRELRKGVTFDGISIEELIEEGRE